MATQYVGSRRKDLFKANFPVYSGVIFESPTLSEITKPLKTKKIGTPTKPKEKAVSKAFGTQVASSALRFADKW